MRILRERGFFLGPKLSKGDLRNRLKNHLFQVPRVISAFGHSNERTFQELVSSLGYSRRTVFYLLRDLEKEGLVTRFYLPLGRGRPRLAYKKSHALTFFMNNEYPNSQPTLQFSSRRPMEEAILKQARLENVSITFEKLQEVCKLRIGTACKALVPSGMCRQNLCKLINRI